MMNSRPDRRTNGCIHSRGIAATGKNGDSFAHAQLNHVSGLPKQMSLWPAKKRMRSAFLG
jgi:hypothetical protein